MEFDYARILNTIETADLTPREYRAARRMLDRASGPGILFLDRPDAYLLFGTNTWGDVRRILSTLRDAGILSFHTNDCAYVNFARAESARSDPPPADPPRAESAQPRAESARSDPLPADPPRAESAQPRAESARSDPPPADPPRAESARGCADSARSDAPNKELNALAFRQAIQIHPDSQPDSQEGGTGETPPPPDPAEQARTLALLTDPAVGCDPRLAAALAATYPFAEVRRQVHRFVHDLAHGRVRSPAVLRRRLDGNFAAAITEQDRASPLWARHAGPDELPPVADPDPYAGLTL